MLQLNPPLPMLTPKGEGFAHVLIDYGPESDLYWTVFVTATGEVWTFSNREVRAAKNITLGRMHIGPIPRPVAGDPHGGQGNHPSNGSAIESASTASHPSRQGTSS